jgi:DNA (cytosine-5)-methyltransferase 1
LIYGSVCSGIEAASCAWHPLGWEPAFFSEIDAFPRAVLQHRFPEVPLHGDFTTIQPGDYRPIDLLVGGTPCQSFSIAGLRKGLDDDRGNLALEYLRLADRLRPQWLVWENVPGVLSSSGGRDFGAFLGGLVELGYGFAYRVLDAQFFGVAQRRRRVFVVGYLGDWRPAAAVLFERHSLQGHPAPSRGERPGIASAAEGGAGDGGGGQQPFDVANCLTARMHKGINTTVDEGQTPVVVNALTANGVGTCGADDNQAQAGAQHGVATFDLKRGLAPNGSASESDIAFPLTASDYKDPQLVRIHTFNDDGTARTLTARHDSSPCADRGPDVVAVAFHPRHYSDRPRMGGEPSDVVHTLSAQAATGDSSPHVATAMRVRRLTPTECERLQGFPDGWTQVPYRGKPASDGPRYKAIGNSMAVPVMAWIGRRIAEVNTIISLKEAA